MRTRFLRGTTTENNGLTLEPGELTVDLEAKALRLHDGSTPGGFEMLGTQAYEPPYSTLVAGNVTAGFYGEVPAADFITGGDLATAVGLSAGTLQHDTTPWLKFALDGKTLYIPQKPIRYNLSWGSIYQAGVVYGIDGFGSNPSGTSVDQGKTVTIGGQTYRVRLLRGASVDPTTTDPTGYDVTASHGSEWNRLLYPVHSGVHTNSNNPTPHTDPNADPYASWASYSDADLLVHLDFGNGSYSWCQDSTASDYRVFRGRNGVSHFHYINATYIHAINGWRPCLELIQ